MVLHPPQLLTNISLLTFIQSHTCIKLGRKEGTALRDMLLLCFHRKATLCSILQPRWEVESHGHGAGHLCLWGWTTGFCTSCSQTGKEHLLWPFSDSKRPFGPTSTYKSSLPTTSGMQQCRMEGGTFSRHLRDLINLRESKSTPGSSGMTSTHSSPACPIHHSQVSKSYFMSRAAQRAPLSPWAHLSHHGTKHQHEALLNI